MVNDEHLLAKSFQSLTQKSRIYLFVSHTPCSRVFTNIFNVQITPFQFFVLFQINNYFFRIFFFLFKYSINFYLQYHFQPPHNEQILTYEFKIYVIGTLYSSYITQHISSFAKVIFMIQNGAIAYLKNKQTSKQTKQKKKTKYAHLIGLKIMKLCNFRY